MRSFFVHYVDYIKNELEVLEISPQMNYNLIK